MLRWRSGSLFVTAAIALSLVSGALFAEPSRASGPCSNAGAFAGGVGSDDDPYQIATPGQLQHFAAAITATFGTANSGLINNRIVLTADLDLGGCAFASHGSGVPFRGKFDGQNHSIANLSVTKSGSSQAGLFASTANGADIRNLRLVSPTVLSGSYVGSLIGEGAATNLSNITVSNGSVTGSASSVGGVAGRLTEQDGKTVENLVVSGTTVIGGNNVGGLFGLVTMMNLSQVSFAEGRVRQTTTSPGYAGGLVGWFGSAASPNRVLSSIQQSSFSGSVEVAHANTASAGLFIGNLRNTAVAVTDSYAIGFVKTGAATIAAGAVGRIDALNFGSALNLNRVYLRASFHRLGTPANFVNAHAFASNVANTADSFYDAENHTQWSSTVGGTAKTSSELGDPTTYAAPWSVTQDADAIRAQATPAEVWLIDDQINSGYPVHVWAYRAGLHVVECPVGRYSVDGLAPCVLASPGSFVATTGATAQQTCPAGETSDAGAASCFVPVSQDFAYRGPLVSGVNAGLAGGSNGASAESAGFSVGDRVVLSGSRLAQVSSVSISGVTSDAVCSEASCEFVVPEGASPGLQDLVLLGSHGVLTIQDGIRINPAPAALPDGLRAWTRDLGDGTVKVYARDVVGVGKVQFFVNGREVAWVRAADASDPKLRTPSAGPMAGVSYLVRTVPLVAGKNVIEIYVSGERVRRVASGR